ncbi:secondary thiamine-phosphate synthase enzyme YjbQ [Lyngbya confervoides]|uniref:Secondary thiamine-phosphate synthase enzyme YjbQ n=1 Tax=Lyngbya confervoides BDU141951 TaxID=1574623 RepID=A0ABD4T0I2_9CYAN|nr:secondary thiamine-phosphate synthase enzyme YjbQ [Lyngbya confervoides]MCM1982164.1 secondary thiamine-phosphate synthase enzyme YjbQ [Lyngbya confervoides BDU141951]
MICYSTYLTLKTCQPMEIIDLTTPLREQVRQSQVQQGQILVSVQHTTTALAINENESRLWQDIETFFQRLVPASDRYRHNDLHLRDVPADEPENAHAHLIALLLGSNEAIAIQAGDLVLGQYQSVLFLELDGPRQRRVHCQIMGMGEEA